MTIEEILKNEDVKKRLSYLTATTDTIPRPIDKWTDEYKGQHEILHKPNKEVGFAPETLADGTTTEDTRKTVITAKITAPFQKNIVRLAVAFAVGGGTELQLLNTYDEKAVEVFKKFRNTINRTKIDSFNMKLAKTLFIESKVAELWYVQAKEVNGVVEKTLKNYLMSQENGDEIYPHFNEFGDMDAFTRKFSIANAEGKQETRYTIYTDNKIINIVKPASGDYITTEEVNIFGKIPVIYYDQKIAEWEDVQVMIDRLEMILSKLADMNDYFASPTAVITGEVESMPNKDDVGKVIRIPGEEIEGKMNYGGFRYEVWKNSPETTKFEVELLLENVNSLTSTPDISFNNIKNLNGSISGVALQTMFLDAILKGKEKQTLILSEGLTRRINLVKTMLKTVSIKEYSTIEDIEVGINFKSILPNDMQEMIEALSTARSGDKLMSEKTAVTLNPLVKDAETEMENIKEEEAEQAGTLGE